MIHHFDSETLENSSNTFPDSLNKLKVDELKEGDDESVNEPFLDKIIVSEEISGMPITEFPLSVRLNNVLNALNINLMGELNGMSYADFQANRNCGATTVSELIEILESAEKGQLETHHPEQINFPQEIIHLPISVLPLSVRLGNVLDTLGIRLLGDLNGMTFTEFRSAKNCGNKTVTELNSLIETAKLGEFDSIIQKYQEETYRSSLYEQFDYQETESKTIERTNNGKISKKEKMFLRFIYDSPRKLNHIRKAKEIIPLLEQKGLLETVNNIVQLTVSGKNLIENLLQNFSFDTAEITQFFLLQKKIESERKLQEKSEEFLSLYKQGLSYQEIGDLQKPTISRERVRQILTSNPNFQDYLEEYEQSKIRLEQEKEKNARLRNIEKSLAAQFPDRVDELWDWERNEDLNPAEIPAHSASFDIWLRCPKDGHSWRKKPAEIVTSWGRSKTSGCPVCVGRTKKPEKHPKLTDVYPQYVTEYWDFEANKALGLNPDELTLGSNYKAWFKCPLDGNRWQSSISSTIQQQWSKGNAGCRVCNGTHLRKVGLWGKAGKLSEVFPNEVESFWNFEKNDLLGLFPEEITTGSAKKAWFKCPIDEYEWQAGISAITNSSWKRGNSGCPSCRGLIATDKSSLVEKYSEFVDKYWDCEKNNQLKVFPQYQTKGSSRFAWFKCPLDGYEWQQRINTIRKYFWDNGKSGCLLCRKANKIEVRLPRRKDVENPAELIADLPSKLDLPGLLDYINKFLAELPSKVQEIVLDRFGGNFDEKVLTLEEIGNKLQIKRGRVYLIQVRAVTALKNRIELIPENALESLKYNCLTSLSPLTPRFLVYLTNNEFSLFQFPPAFYIRLLRELLPELPILPEGKFKNIYLAKKHAEIADRIKIFLDAREHLATSAEIFDYLINYTPLKNLSESDFFEALHSKDFEILDGDSPGILLVNLNKRQTN